ncbi:MAG TPA: HIT domain-containing protein [Anaerolineales bacterium]|nr:HIT domain-containing protein [Anaerolineales bacterium]
MFSALILRLARWRVVGGLIGWLFARHSRWLPLRRLSETATEIAFWHPRPSYPVHILIVPKQAVRALADLAPGEPNPAGGLVSTAAEIARSLGLSRYRLVLNGGAFQDVPQLHVHLIVEP